MSGIAAIIYCDGQKASRSDIDRVVRALRAYGPERQTVKLVGPVAFAYAHFTATPEGSPSDQPLTGSDGRFTMVFDGRLDNREDLGAELNLEKHRMLVLSDAQLALLSWARWGKEAMNHWIGEFAFIVWDKTEGYLTAARDQFGARTLHYNANSTRVVIASAPKCIHALGDVPRELDEQKIADALSQIYYDGERTFFKEIKRVAAASLMTVSGTSVKVEKYYDFRDNVRPVRYKDDRDYVEAARELFDASVRATLRSPRPVGAFLSGGLDSSTMSVHAAQALGAKGKKLITYTSVPEEGWDQQTIKGLFGDEAPYVSDIAKLTPNIEANFVDGAGMGHYHKQEELLLALEMPVRNALNLQWTHAILEKAKGRGIGVMLQGVFGNATLSHSGDGVFGELLSQGSVFRLYSELAAISSGPRHFLRNTFKHLVFPFGPEWLWTAKERLRGRPSPEEYWQRFIPVAPAFAEEMNVSERTERAGYSFLGGKPQSERKAWFNIITNWMTEIGDVNQGLRAIYGIEIRDPFANRRLVEWSFGLPEAQFHRNGVNRWLIRRMMEGKLPDSVLHNKKRGHQTADWHLRMSRDLPAMRREVSLIADDPDLSRMIDVDLLRKLLDEWPESTITDLADDRVFQLPVILPMTLQIARFVQREKGVNTQY